MRARRRFHSFYFIEDKKTLPVPFLSLHHFLIFCPRLCFRAKLERDLGGRQSLQNSSVGDCWPGKTRSPARLCSAAPRARGHVPRCHRSPARLPRGGQGWTGSSSGLGAPSSSVTSVGLRTVSGISQRQSRLNYCHSAGHQHILLFIT